MIRIEIELKLQSLRNERIWIAPVAIAVDEAGEVPMKSLAALLTAAVALLPWAQLLSLVVLPLSRMWRRRRARKRSDGQAAK